MNKKIKTTKIVLISVGVLMLIAGFIALIAERHQLGVNFLEERGMLFAAGGFSLFLGIAWKGKNNSKS